MHSFRQCAGIGVCLGLFGLNVVGPAQARPVKDTRSRPDQSQCQPKKTKKHSRVVPILVGGCALFTLAPEGGGSGVSGLTTNLSDTGTGAAVVGTVPGSLAGTSQPPSGQNGGLSASLNSVTVVPEMSSWAAFALTGLGAVGLGVWARKRLGRAA